MIPNKISSLFSWAVHIKRWMMMVKGQKDVLFTTYFPSVRELWSLSKWMQMSSWIERCKFTSTESVIYQKCSCFCLYEQHADNAIWTEEIVIRTYWQNSKSTKNNSCSFTRHELKWKSFSTQITSRKREEKICLGWSTLYRVKELILVASKAWDWIKS